MAARFLFPSEGPEQGCALLERGVFLALEHGFLQGSCKPSLRGLPGSRGDCAPCVGLDFPNCPAESGLMQACIVFRARGKGSENGLPIVLTECTLEGWVDWPAHANSLGRVPGLVLKFFPVLECDV
jgi:hypothetical protein